MSAYSSLSRILSILRTGSDDLDTARGRSHERYRLAALSASTSFIAKAVSIGTSLITVRLAFRYLGAERYGMWLTISSIVMMFGSADLGMSNGLVNHIADAVGREDRIAAKEASASGFWMLSGVASILTMAMLVAYPFLNTARIFNIHSSIAIHESGPTFLVFFYCFVLNLPLGAVRAIQTGLQKGFFNSLWAILGLVLSLAALLMAIHAQAGLPVLVLGLSGAPLLASFLNGAELFGFSHRELMPRLRNFSRAAASRLLHTGLRYFLIQIAIAIGMQTDNVVIAQILGANAVAAYAVPARLFNILVALAALLSGSLWPAYTEALARSEGAWVRRSFLRVIAVGVGTNAALSVVLFVFGNWILRIWVGPQIQASKAFLAVLGLVSIVSSGIGAIGVLLNGLGRFREQAVTGLLMAVMNLVLSIIFVKHYGALGAALGTLVALTLVQVVPLSLLTRRLLNDLTT